MNIVACRNMDDLLIWTRWSVVALYLSIYMYKLYMVKYMFIIIRKNRFGHLWYLNNYPNKSNRRMHGTSHAVQRVYDHWSSPCTSSSKRRLHLTEDEHPDHMAMSLLLSTGIQTIDQGRSRCKQRGSTIRDVRGSTEQPLGHRPASTSREAM